MREIKFRVWDKNRKRMYFWENIEAIHNNGILVIVADNNDWMLVPPNYELLQYTGLKDEQGKEIYEGDIIIWEHIYAGREGPGEIVYLSHFDNESKGYYLGYWIKRNQNIVAFDPINSWRMMKPNSIEVLGNIYENPELLEK